MRYPHLRRWIFALALPCLVSCGGGSQQQPPAVPAPQNQQTVQLQPQSLSVQSSSSTLNLNVNATSKIPASALTLATAACPMVPAIRLYNPFPIPLTIAITSFTITLRCTPTNPLYGATFYQLIPQPATVSPVKLGNASANGRTLTFTPQVSTLTLPPRTTSQITILPEQSTNEVAYPVAPGSTTVLTSGNTTLPSGLNFTYTTSSGGTTYTVACFPAYNGDTLAPALVGVPLVGTPSFYCHITPVNASTITFGNVVTFSITDPKPDRAIFEPDGNAQGFECNNSTQCNVPSFSVPTTYDNFIVGNVQDLRMCVPAVENTDCNGVAGDTQGGSLTTVTVGQEFQLLVADDPTYAPGTAWDGLFRMNLSGPCALATSSDNSNGDVPPKYSDKGTTGTGPNAEFDVTATGTGTCTITASEDERYILDYTNPENPQPHSATLVLNVTGEVPQ